MFKGQETYSVDDKGRVSVPAKVRRQLSPEADDTFVLTRGVDRCIVAYPLDVWKRYEQRLAELNPFNAEDRLFLRSLLRWSEDVQLDRQNRIMLPRRLMEFAGITDRVTIVGMIDHLELWNPEELEQQVAEQEKAFAQIAEKVMGEHIDRDLL